MIRATEAVMRRGERERWRIEAGGVVEVDPVNILKCYYVSRVSYYDTLLTVLYKPPQLLRILSRALKS